MKCLQLAALFVTLSWAQAVPVVPRYRGHKKIHHRPENEVLKDIEVGLKAPLNVPPSTLEAFYYGLYGDLENNNMGTGRQGNSTSVCSCDLIRSVPSHLRDQRYMRPHGLSSIYTKYTEAYDIPVLGTDDVSDRAVSRACYVLRYLLADRGDLRDLFYHNYGRVAVLSEDMAITEIPEYSGFLPAEYNLATRGLGAVRIAPVATAGVENILCWGNDTDSREDVLVRTIAHSVAHLAAKYLIPDFRSSLERMYERAMLSGWWDGTYAAYTADSYFGQALQAYLNVGGFADPANGRYNTISTRTKLRSIDPEIYSFIQQLLPCGNTYLKRCNSRGYEAYQTLVMDCPVRGYIPRSIRRQAAFI